MILCKSEIQIVWVGWTRIIIRAFGLKVQCSRWDLRANIASFLAGVGGLPPLAESGVDLRLYFAMGGELAFEPHQISNGSLLFESCASDECRPLRQESYGCGADFVSPVTQEN